MLEREYENPPRGDGIYQKRHSIPVEGHSIGKSSLTIEVRKFPAWTFLLYIHKPSGVLVAGKSRGLRHPSKGDLVSR
jgi:hypothetical protein